MARFNKIQTLTAMTGTGMVPVFYHSDIEVCKRSSRPAMTEA